MKKYLPYLFLIIALGGAVGYFMYSYAPSTLEKNESDFAIKNIDAITQVRLTDQEGKTLLLTKKDGQWLVNGKYPARDETLSLLFTAFQKMNTLSPVPVNAQENVLKDMVKAHVKCEIFLGNEKPEKVYWVGGATNDNKGTYMVMELDGKMARQPYITLVPGMNAYLTPRYRVNEEDWRSRTIFSYKLEEIQSLSLIYNRERQKSFSLEQVAKDSFVIANSDGSKAQQTKQSYIQQYLSFYENISAEAFENSNPIRDTIVKEIPYCTVTITKKDKSVQRTIVYYMPLNGRSKMQFDENGRKMLYDLDHYYALVNDDKDFALVQFYVWSKILRNYEEFFVKPKPRK